MNFDVTCDETKAQKSMRDDRLLVVAIVGPTASGKSAVGIELAKLLDGEIISADSMQVYRGMNIGTAKIKEPEMQGIAHHLLDVCDLDSEFNVSKYQILAHEKIESILNRGKAPIVVGGTGLYVDALLSGFIFPDSGKDESLRDQLVKEGEEKGSQILHDRLKEVDQEAAAKIHPNDIRRIVRALEVYITTGKPISELQREHKASLKYRSIYFGLRTVREEVRNRIDERVDKMLDEGLLDEVKALVAAGFSDCIVSMQAIGYKELVAYLRGEISYEDAVEAIKTETKKYAKRQDTWFRKNKDINWVDVSASSDLKAIADQIAETLKTQLGD